MLDLDLVTADGPVFCEEFLGDTSLPAPAVLTRRATAQSSEAYGRDYNDVKALGANSGCNRMGQPTAHSSLRDAWSMRRCYAKHGASSRCRIACDSSDCYNERR
jgi:hypothetical protein